MLKTSARTLASATQVLLLNALINTRVCAVALSRPLALALIAHHRHTGRVALVTSSLGLRHVPAAAAARQEGQQLHEPSGLVCRQQRQHMCSGRLVVPERIQGAMQRGRFLDVGGRQRPAALGAGSGRGSSRRVGVWRCQGQSALLSSPFAWSGGACSPAVCNLCGEDC